MNIAMISHSTAAVNLCVNVPPGAILPLSKLPSSAVTVCAVASLFVHVTVVPLATLNDATEKAKFFIETVFPVSISAAITSIATTAAFTACHYVITIMKSCKHKAIHAGLINRLIS